MCIRDSTSEAQKDLEMVRARARGGNPDILPEMTSLDQSVLREAIRHERRVELGLEFDRFYDLVRWGIAEQMCIRDSGTTGSRLYHGYQSSLSWKNRK